MSGYNGPRFALWMALTLTSCAATAVTPLDDGDFESGALAGWSSSGRLGGFAAVVTEGECFSSFDTTGLVLSGNHAGLVRAGRPAEPGSTGTLTSRPFTAGIGVAFSALTETIEAARLPDMPVNFSVRILDAESGAELAAVGLSTAVVPLTGACHQHPVNGAFRTHYVDTRRFTGRAIRIQFSQSSKVRRAGLFTLVDDVVRLDAEDSQVLPDRPRAVAGVSRSGGGRLRLDGSRSSEPSQMVLSFQWTIDGEAFTRDGEFPCIDDLDPGDYRATLVVSNGLHLDADTVGFVVREPVESGDDDDDDGDGEGDDEETTDALLSGEGDSSAPFDCSDSPTNGADDDAGTTDEDADNGDGQQRQSLTASSDAFHHWNPVAWDGRGVALVMCPSTNGMDACELNGQPLERHGNRDKGRDVWTDYDGPTGQSGTVRCRRGAEQFEFRVSATADLEFGDC